MGEREMEGRVGRGEERAERGGREGDGRDTGKVEAEGSFLPNSYP